MTLLLMPALVNHAKPGNRTSRRNVAQPDSAYIKIRRLLDWSLKNGDLDTAGLCYQQIGDILFEEGALSQALSYYHKADAYFTKDTSLINLGNNLNRIGKIYFKNKQNSTALNNFREAPHLFRMKGNHKEIAESYGYIGQVFEQKGPTTALILQNSIWFVNPWKFTWKLGLKTCHISLLLSGNTSAMRQRRR